ncbi:mitochondrial fission regulator 1 isoform X1 [Callorhinchus milii]|uniref:Mitochondrial fission regulator n=1 Tax=Callorhinchus milii TaxID=7868 RepID=K4GDV8_CALMI|nr:mitochondrial fission regulator 1 [Callorhinchus milii]XP_007894932.1 mitochondrial fission regulator 1 isoform X1 [Callorhinchus milii]XP_007894933.1 mitochondrial fission regulator 1 isoform X1 [Callorhinchus milii]AFM91021.1 mitochondrial fission regulator 1 [Callorhinchus milii]|eukprot:gi/632958251/ref/XP_007894930.1/ PREDICTED: mitochondrial fission regulator 1 isoform X1 [Callorhinchus milii]
MFLLLIQMIRTMTEYAGVAMDSVQLFGSKKPYGSSRSIIRRIGTSLPLSPCPRIQFQLFHAFGEGDQTNQKSGDVKERAVASLADVGWIVGDEGESFTRFISEVRPICAELTQQTTPCIAGSISRIVSSPKNELEPATPTLANDEALQKINVLENELAKLREQIAMIVTIQEKNSLSAVTPGAAPLCALAPPPPPPPPPPLPPPPPFQQSMSAIDLIKERRGKRADSDQNLTMPQQQTMPNMLDILKDINKVKLRSVKKSVNDLKVKPDQSSVDPTALIAAALKRKFAHRYKNDSCEIESQFSKSDFMETAEPPNFGQHMLKPAGKRKLLLAKS